MINQFEPGRAGQFQTVIVDKILATRVIEQVHLKLGNSAFEEFISLDLQFVDEFFWKYLKWNWDRGRTVYNELKRVLQVLNGMKDHPDIQVYFSTTLSEVADGTAEQKLNAIRDGKAGVDIAGNFTEFPSGTPAGTDDDTGREETTPGGGIGDSTVAVGEREPGPGS